MDVERYVVAIVALGTTPEAEARALATDLGTTMYEERLKLTPGFPAIVLTTTDDGAAQALLAKLQARRHRALVCRRSEVVRASEMVQMRHFQFEPDGLESGGDRLPWTDLAALVRARHRQETTTTEVVKQKKFDATRALLTGGLIMRKTEKREVSSTSEDIEHVLYVFRAS